MENIEQIISIQKNESQDLPLSDSQSQSSYAIDQSNKNISFDEQLNLVSEEQSILIDDSSELFDTQYLSEESSYNQEFDNDLTQFIEESRAQSRLIATLNHQLDIQPSKTIDAQSLADRFLHARIQELYHSKSTAALPKEPLVDFDKQNMKVSIEFPMLEDLKSVTVQYDAATRSVAAEMLTSSEVAKLLQAQVAQLERNLAKHDIKLQELKIATTVTASEGNGGNNSRQNQQKFRGQSQNKS